MTTRKAVLSLAMQPSDACESGYQYNSLCVCFDALNRVYMCSGDDRVYSTSAPAVSSTSAPSDNQIPSASRRLLPLVAYFLLLAAIFAFIYYSAKRNAGSATAEPADHEEVDVEAISDV